MQVETEVVGQLLVVENVVEQPFVPRPQQDGVVLHVLVGAVRPEVPDEQAHRVVHVLHLAVRPRVAVLGRHEVPVGPAHVGVGDHEVGGDFLARGEAHPAGRLVLHEDLIDLRAVALRDVEVRKEVRQALHERAGAAHGVPHAPLALQMCDERVDGGRAERVPPHQQRVEGQHLPDLGVGDVLGDEAVHRAVALQLHHRRHDAEHVRHVVERHVAELLEADLEDLFAFFQEAPVPVHVLRREAADFLHHFVGVARVVEGGPVVEADAVEGVDGHELHVVLQVAPAEGPELLEQKRRGNDGGPGVERKAVLLEDARPAAGLIEAVEKRHPKATRPQSDGGREPAHSGPNDDGVGRVGPGRCRFGARVEGGVVAVGEAGEPTHASGLAG